MSNDDTPRAHTPEEVRTMLIGHFRMMVHWWATTKISPEDLAKMNESELHYRLSGLVFSILNVFDGTSSLPAFNITPAPHPDDQKHCQDEGSNWFEPIVINECMLHDLWYQTK